MRRRDYAEKKFSHPLRGSAAEKSTGKTWSRGFRLTIIVIFLLTIIYFVLFTNWLVVKNIKVAGTSRADISESIYIWLNERAGQRVLRFLPANHIIWLDPSDIGAAFESDKYIASAAFSKKLPASLVVTIVERHPVLLYEFDNLRYLVDGQAQLIELARPNNTPAALPLVTSTSTQILLSNLDQNKLDFIIQIYNLWSTYMSGTKLTEFIANPNNSDIAATPETDWSVYFSSTEDPVVQLSNLSRTYKEKISDSEKENLQYIDVRLLNYVYYK